MEEQYRKPNSETTNPNIGHSGKLPEGMRETPPADFDNTPLEVTEGVQLNNVPLSPATMPEAMPPLDNVIDDEDRLPLSATGSGTQAETGNERKGRKLFIGLGAGAAAVAIGAGALFMGLKSSADNDSNNEPPQADPKATSETAPATQNTGVEGQPITVEALSIPTGLSSEELGKVLIGDRFSAWNNAGASDSLVDASIEANKSWDDFLPMVVEKNKEVFAEALYVPGWQSDPELAQFVEGSAKGNLGILKAYVSSAWNGDEVPANKEGYRQWEEVQSVTEVPDNDPNDDIRTIDVAVIVKDNSDRNTVPSPVDGKIDTYTITLQAIDGNEKISKISIH